MGSQDLNFNIFNIIILIGIFQGFVFTGIVFCNKNYRVIPNYFLVFTALSLSFNNLQYLLIDIKLVEKLYFQIPFEFLIMPMFYVFVEKYLKIKHSIKTLVLLFIPFISSLILRLIIKFISISENLRKILLTLEEYLSLIFSVFIISLILYQILNYEKRRKDFDIKKIKAKTKWLKQSLIIGIITCLSWLFVIQDNIARFDNDLAKYYPLWIIISILVYWIVFKGIIETRIINQRVEIRSKNIDIITPNKVSIVSSELFLEIEKTIIDEKLYVNPNLNLELIANNFNVSISHLSKIINKNANQSFTDFINGLRVKRAKKMLSNPEFKNYTIEAIGYESGFNSKSNFYSAFKKETQNTPSAFRSKF
ncbi:helix-turn-helix transcriptional regulator [uncultured Aquimarina sp.]|uniref:helix-turn-helix domain-containing protein n=1 Tax=uncultured Aquimarina sp. TaxID=575652 RepID=UPI00261336A3|nr:helix-turn-helix transcriptional regulator [uncultured Aquimarina sp.]